MHIPDGFLDAKTWGALWVVSGGSSGYAANRVRGVLGDRHVPLMGVTAAFIFAVQMLNFPVAAGTSGHFMGAALAAVLLGPWSGCLIMAVVLAVQCLVFADGGVTALGANIFNMGIAGCFSAHWIVRALGKLTGGRFPALAAFLAAWASIVVAAAVCALELAVSGAAPLSAVLPAMGGVHALIGIGEGVITVLVLRSLAAARPDLLELRKV